MPSIQLNVIKQLTRVPKLVVTDTMNYWIENCLADLLLVIAKTDILIINDEEALELSNESNLVDAAKKIQSLGPKFIIIKKGTDGAILFSKSNTFSCPAFIVNKCIDPTGAGDTFAGAFIGHLNSSNDLSFDNMKTAVIQACAMASFCVQDFGVNNIINRKRGDIENRINTLINVVKN